MVELCTDNRILHMVRFALDFQSDGMAPMQINRDESALSSGEEDNTLTGNCVVLPQQAESDISVMVL